MTDQKHIYVATPMYGGMGHQRYIESVMMFMNHCSRSGISTTFSFMGNESLITRARNALVHEFMKTTCTHLFFIDADIGFRSGDAVKMIEADKDIIAGVYPKKDINWRAVAQAAKDGIDPMDLPRYAGDFVVNVDHIPDGGLKVPTDQPFAVANAGTGMMLIKRKVFEDLADKVPEYINNMTSQNKGLLHQERIKEYFATSIDPKHQVLLSEDYHFCQVWKRHGGEVHVAPWADLTHNGTYEFAGHFQRGPA